MSATLPDTLPCGADVDALLEQVAESPAGPLTPHEAGCVHCQAALAEFVQLWRPVAAAAAERVQAPAALVERVVARVRALVGSAGWAVLETPGGHTRVAVDVVLSVARLAVDGVPGVRGALASLVPVVPAEAVPAEVAAEDVTVGVSGSTVAVRLTVAAAHGIDLPALGRRVADRVRGDVEELVGLSVAAVTVHVDDVLPSR